MTFYQDHLRFWIWVSGCRIQVNSFPCQHRLPWDVFLSVCFFFPPFCLLQHKDTGVQRLKRRNSGDDVAKCYRLVYLTCNRMDSACPVTKAAACHPQEIAKAESETNEKFGSTTPTFAWGHGAFAKGGVFFQIEMRGQNGDSWSTVTFARHSIGCSSPQTPLSSIAFSTGGGGGGARGWGGDATCQVISHELCWGK